MSNENIDIITLANRVANEKENIRQAIETRGVDIPPTTPLNQYPAKIMAINTENTASDVYFRDSNFDTSVTSFTLPGNYGVVADGALAGYDKLESLDLQYTSALFPEACANDTSLTSLTANHLKYVGNNALANTGLTELNNGHIKQVGAGGLENCASLTSVTLNNCEDVQSAAFSGDTSLESVSLPECKKIGTFAFDGDSMLSSINLPKVEQIQSEAFANAGRGAYTQYGRTIEVDLPECTHLGSYVFKNVSNITSVNLPKCTEIGSGCFYASSSYSYQTDITYINMPEVVTLGSYNFYKLSSNATKYCYLPKIINLANCTSIGTNCFNYPSSAYADGELVISNSGCSIDAGVFGRTDAATSSPSGYVTSTPTKVTGKITSIGGNSFIYYINNASTSIDAEHTMNIDIDFSSIRYGNSFSTSRTEVFFKLLNDGATSNNATVPFFHFTGGALDFSSYADTNYASSDYIPIFFSEAQTKSSGSSRYSLQQHNIKKIWIPSTAVTLKIGLMGSSSAEPIHIYTDASAAKSTWYLAQMQMTNSAFTTGTSAPYAIVHTNCTHQDFENGTYNS